MIYSPSVTSYIAFRQIITQRPTVLSVSNTLVTTQTVRHNIRTRRLSNKLTLTQGVTYRRSIAKLSVGHTLLLYNSVNKDPVYKTVTQAFLCYQSIALPKTDAVSQSVNLVQSIVANNTKGVTSTLAMTSTVLGNIVKAVTVSQTLTSVNGVSAWLTNANFNYLNPVFVVNEKVRFRYQTNDVYLRKPEFDDTYGYEFTRIKRNSRGGDLIISRDPMWPSQKTFRISFAYLTAQEIAQMLDFTQASLGRKVRYLNYDNIEWEGYIMNPQGETVQAGRSNRTLTIEFQGEPLS